MSLITGRFYLDRTYLVPVGNQEIHFIVVLSAFGGECMTQISICIRPKAAQISICSSVTHKSQNVYRAIIHQSHFPDKSKASTLLS